MDGLGVRACLGVDQFTGPQHPHSLVGRPPRCHRHLRLCLSRLRPQSPPASSSTSSGSESPPPSEERSTTTSSSRWRPHGAFSGTASTAPPRCRRTRGRSPSSTGAWTGRTGYRARHGSSISDLGYGGLLQSNDGISNPFRSSSCVNCIS